jgi:hypothetical protein
MSKEEIAEKEVVEKELTAEEMLENLLGVSGLPSRKAVIDRLGIQFTVTGLDGKTVGSLRKSCTMRRPGRKGEIIEELDNEEFGAAIIEAATDFPWSDPRLTEKHKASSGRQVILRTLLAGELDKLSELVMELSGFDKDLDDVKN